MKKKISIVVPIYNEEQNILDFLKNLISVINKQKYSSEIIVVDDGSTDNTEIIIKEFLNDSRVDFKYLKNELNMGRGYSVTRGFSEAKGESLVYLDADIKINKSSLNKFIDQLNSYDLVIGSKHMKNSRFRSSTIRLILSKSYATLARLLLTNNINDFQCGIKSITKNAFWKIQGYLKENRWSWDTEVLMYAFLHNLKIKEIPINTVFYKRDTKVKLYDSIDLGFKLIHLWLRKMNYINLKSHFNRRRSYKEQRYTGIQKLFRNEENVLLKLVDAQSTDKILELGCGDGYFTEKFHNSGANVYGIDISENMIKQLEKYSIPFKVTDMQNFRLNQKFNKIVISGATEFAANFDQTLRNINLHLIDNGRLIFMFIRKSFMGYLYSIYYLLKGIKVKLYSHNEIEHMLKNKSFTDINIESINSLSSSAYSVKTQ